MRKKLLYSLLLIAIGFSFGRVSVEKKSQNSTLPSVVISPSQTSSLQPTQVLSQSDQELTNTPQMFLVTKVIDGDTVQLDNGKTARLIGIDTPETVDPRKSVQCFGKEASEKTRGLVEGKRVRLEKDVSETDRYGRLLRYVYIDSIFVNDYLVRQGFAYASSYPPDVKYQEKFNAAQKEARENNRGLWAACSSMEESASGVSNISTGDQDCKDFKTQKEAQAFFISQGGPAKDPHKLDADKDGVVCENLP